MNICKLFKINFKCYSSVLFTSPSSIYDIWHTIYTQFCFAFLLKLYHQPQIFHWNNIFHGYFGGTGQPYASKVTVKYMGKIDKAKTQHAKANSYAVSYYHFIGIVV